MTTHACLHRSPIDYKITKFSFVPGAVPNQYCLVGLWDYIDVGINCDVFVNIVMLMCVINNHDVLTSQANGTVMPTFLHF